MADGGGSGGDWLPSKNDIYLGGRGRTAKDGGGATQAARDS